MPDSSLCLTLFFRRKLRLLLGYTCALAKRISRFRKFHPRRSFWTVLWGALHQCKSCPMLASNHPSRFHPGRLTDANIQALETWPYLGRNLLSSGVKMSSYFLTNIEEDGDLRQHRLPRIQLYWGWHQCTTASCLDLRNESREFSRKNLVDVHYYTEQFCSLHFPSS